MLIAFSLSMCTGALGQLITTFVGQPEAPSAGPFETPFPTASAVTARTQYLIGAAELTFLPNLPIEGFVMEILDSDPLGTTVDLEVRMKNTITPCLPGQQLSGLTLVADTQGLQLQSGILTIPFNISYFNWAGGGTPLLLEIGMRRNGPPGVDPRVPLDTSFVCEATAWVQDPTLMGLDTINAQNAAFNGVLLKRPVLGLLTSSSASFTEITEPIQVVVHPNPATDRITLRLLQGPDRVRVRLLNALGAVVLDATPPVSTHGAIDVPLTGLASGCYLLQLTDEAQRPIWQQRVVVQ